MQECGHHNRHISEGCDSHWQQDQGCRAHAKYTQSGTVSNDVNAVSVSEFIINMILLRITTAIRMHLLGPVGIMYTNNNVSILSVLHSRVYCTTAIIFFLWLCFKISRKWSKTNLILFAQTLTPQFNRLFSRLTAGQVRQDS